MRLACDVVWWGVGFVERLGGEHITAPAVALAATGGPAAAAAAGPFGSGCGRKRPQPVSGTSECSRFKRNRFHAHTYTQPETRTPYLPVCTQFKASGCDNRNRRCDYYRTRCCRAASVDQLEVEGHSFIPRAAPANLDPWGVFTPTGCVSVKERS